MTERTELSKKKRTQRILRSNLQQKAGREVVRTRSKMEPRSVELKTERVREKFVRMFETEKGQNRQKSVTKRRDGR